MADNKVKQYVKSGELAYAMGDSLQKVSIGNKNVFAQSASVSDDTEMKEYKGNDGRVCALVIPQVRQTITIEGLMLKDSASADLPEKGSEVKIPTGMVTGILSGVKWRLDSISVNWSNEDVTKVSLTVKSYDF